MESIWAHDARHHACRYTSGVPWPLLPNLRVCRHPFLCLASKTVPFEQRQIEAGRGRGGMGGVGGEGGGVMDAIEAVVDDMGACVRLIEAAGGARAEEMCRWASVYAQLATHNSPSNLDSATQKRCWCAARVSVTLSQSSSLLSFSVAASWDRVVAL